MKFKILLLLGIMPGFWCCDDADDQEESVTLSIAKETGTDTVSWQAGSFDVKVFSNGNWLVEVLSDGNWMEVSSNSGYGDQEVCFNYAENTEEELRTAYISFSTVDMRRVISISQLGKSSVPDDDNNEGESDHEETGTHWIKLLSETLYDQNGNERTKNDYTYDSEGREIGLSVFYNRQLTKENYDYRYIGQELTYLERYNSTPIKHKIIYYDNNFIKMKSNINYEPDGRTENGRMDFEYDEQGREIGRVQYVKGEIIAKHSNYSYDGNVATFVYDSYENGAVNYTRQCRYVYNDKYWYKCTLMSTYDENGEEIARMEYDYDEQGREMGFRNYNNGKLTYEYKDYVYDNKELTFNRYEYLSGSTTKMQYKRLYY